MSSLSIYVLVIEVFPFRVRRLQLQLDSKTGELQSDLRLKSFETERAQLVLEEQSVGLKKMTLENEKLREKLDVMTKEFYALQSASDKRISELEARCSQQRDKLTAFEKLETELDETILQAAESIIGFLSHFYLIKV